MNPKKCIQCGSTYGPGPKDYPKRFAGRRYCTRHCGMLARSADLPTRLWARVDVRSANECWPWTGATIKNGYGVIGRGGGRHAGNVLTHIAAYVDRVGPVPTGYQVDHLCRVTSCCNPAHLEAVTQQENLRRQAAATSAARTHCVNGHDYSIHGTRTANGRRRCLQCSKANGRKSYLARKALRALGVARGSAGDGPNQQGVNHD